MIYLMNMMNGKLFLRILIEQNLIQKNSSYKLQKRQGADMIVIIFKMIFGL
jgi:hypothetical protein